MSSVARVWESAAQFREHAMVELREIRARYAAANLPPHIKQARLIALDRKIDALNAVVLSGESYPWCVDGEVS